jgi:signal transduction histidine kinase
MNVRQHQPSLDRGDLDGTSARTGAKPQVLVQRPLVDNGAMPASCAELHCALEDCIELAVATCHPALQKRRQRLEIRGLGSGCPLQADPVRLTQILTNLLDNASKYSAQGQVIHLEMRILADTVEMAITDTGIGIAAAALATVFEPFTQSAHAVVFNASGLGIGLAVVRELVQAHGGHVVVSSEGVGRGSRFVVTLPLAQRDQPAGA